MMREDGRRGMKSLRNIYKETRVRVTCYMVCLQNKWIKAAWRREDTKEQNSIVEEFEEIQFEEGNIRIDAVLIEGR